MNKMKADDVHKTKGSPSQDAEKARGGKWGLCWILNKIFWGVEFSPYEQRHGGGKSWVMLKHNGYVPE